MSRPKRCGSCLGQSSGAGMHSLGVLTKTKQHQHRRIERTFEPRAKTRRNRPYGESQGNPVTGQKESEKCLVFGVVRSTLSQTSSDTGDAPKRLRTTVSLAIDQPNRTSTATRTRFLSPENSSKVAGHQTKYFFVSSLFV